MKVLLLSRWFPYPPDNGARIRIFNLIKQLALHHELSLISFADSRISDAQVAELRRYCTDVRLVPFTPYRPRSVKALLSVFSSRPRSVVDTYSEVMADAVQQEARRFKPDMVIGSQLGTAHYAVSVCDTIRVLEELEIAVLYEAYAAQPDPIKRFRHRMTWEKTARYVAGLLRSFDACTVVSDRERELAEGLLKVNLPMKVVPNGVSMADYLRVPVQPEPNTLVYAGSLTFDANYDAVEFFLKDIFPAVRESHPNATLYVTGKTDGVNVDRLLTRKGVVFTGYLADVRPCVTKSWISVVPLRVGGGTRLKIIESLALGTPVISTTKGSEGLDLVPDEDILIADTPADFASAIKRLLGDARLRARMSDNGRRAVQAKYDWNSIGETFCQFADELACERREP